MFCKLREIRRKKGISLEEMAMLLNLQNKSTYHKKEVGNVKFSLEEARKVSEKFSMPIEELFLKIMFLYWKQNQPNKLVN